MLKKNSLRKVKFGLFKDTTWTTKARIAMHAKHLTLGTLGLGLSSLLILAACGDSKKVYFGNLTEGASVESPFKVQMKAEGLIVEPASMGVNEGHGHFHIIVDASLASPSEPMSKDEKHIHFGDGQTETTLDLPVGPHTLILQFAKGDHVPYDPPIYQQISVNVTKQNTPAPEATPQPKPADSTAAKVDSAAAAAPSPAAEPAKAKPAAPAAKKKKAK
jgi:hypothetical protein